jgi:diacylglycerol O-acyltransferase-1
MLAECQDLQPPFLLYPQNITASNLGYFLVAPTLCYQLNYPRIPKIRWTKVLFLVFRLLFVAAILIFAVEQYMVPTLEGVLSPMEKKDVFMIIERLLKLSIPNTYVWLLGFYLFFHLWLNLLAELTRFGDRLFYKEWWNARTIDEYWYVPYV